VAFSADGNHLLAGGAGGATLRDATTGAVTATLASFPIREARFVAPDRVVLAGTDKLVLARTDGTTITSVPLREPHELDVSRDGARVLALAGANIVVASTHDLARIADLPHGDHTFDARFDRDGGVVTAADDGGRRWSLSPERELGRLPWGYSLAWIDDDTLLVSGTLVHLDGSSSERVIAKDITIQCSTAIDRHHAITGGYDRVLRIWDLERSALPIVTLQAAGATSRVIADRAGTRAVSVGAGVVELWNLTALPAPTTVATFAGRVDHVEPDHRGQLTVRWETGSGGRTDLLSASHQVIATLEGWPVGARPDSDDIVTDEDGRMLVYSATDGHRIREIAEAKPIYHIAYSPSGALIATDADSRHIDIRAADSWAILHGFDVPGGVTALALDDADHLVSGHDDGTIRMWNARTGALVHTMTGHTAHIAAVMIRGSTLVSNSWDLTTRRWTFPTGEPLGMLSTGYRLVDEIAVSADGDLIAIADGTNVLAIWDSDHGRLIHRIPTADEIVCATFVDATHVVVGGIGGRLELVDIGVR
jgi:WD40 repeat protein